MVAKPNGGGELLSISVRVAAASIGAYAVTYFLAAALTGGLYRLSVARMDAVMMGGVFALFAFPAVSIWAFGERRLWLVAAAPAGITAILALAAWALKP